jgi:O-antigen/teichoic acid export membrane protein
MTKNDPVDINSAALKSGSWYTLSNVLIRSSGLLTAPIFTRLLTTSDYGIVSNFMAWVGISFVFTSFGLPYCIGNAKVDYKSHFHEVISSIQVLGFIGSLFLLLLSIVFRERLSEIYGLEQNLVVLVYVYLLFYPSVILMQEKYKFNFQYKQNVAISIANTIGAIVLCILFIYIFNDQRYYGRILGLISPMFLMGIYFFIKIFRDGWHAHVTRYWKYALKITIPMIPHSFAMVVLGQIDRVMIIKYCGSSDAGLYSFGYTYAILLSVVSNAVLQAYKPWLYAKYTEKSYESIKHSNKIITLGIAIVTVIIVTVAPEALKILGAKSFWGAKVIVMPIAVGVLFQYVYNTYSGLELYHKKTTIIAIGSVSVAILNFVLNKTFIPIFGFTAAAYTTLTSYFFLALFHKYAYVRVCRRHIYDDRFIWGVILATALISYLIMLYYDQIIIRYSIFTILLVTIDLLQRSRIKLIVRTLYVFYKEK